MSIAFNDAAGRPLRVIRFSIATALLGLVATLAAGPAFAQSWPQRPVTFIVPYPAGGNTDSQARIVAERLSPKLGSQVIVQNRPGATGAIATDFVARAEPDGYTLLFASSAQITSVPMTEKVNYKPDDLIPISASGNGPMIMAVRADLPARTLKEFIDLARASPGKLTYASAGPGSVAHLVAALFTRRAKIELLHVPYKGGAPAVTDLIGGQVDMYFGNAGELMPHAGNSRLRLIGVSTLSRMTQLPNVEAVSEVLPNFEMTAWNGVLAPLKTPQPILDMLAREIAQVAKDQSAVDRLGNLGVEAISTTPAEFRAIIGKEQGIYAEAIEAAGLKRN